MDEVKSTLNNAQENAFAGTEEELLEGWKAALLAADYKGIMTGILHTRNDNVADTVTNEGTDVLYGQDFFYEELLGLRFKITPFLFPDKFPGCRGAISDCQRVYRRCTSKRNRRRYCGAW